MNELNPDVTARYDGTIALMEPQTLRADEWFTEHLPEDARRFGRMWPVEDVAFLPTVERMQEDGLVVDVYNTGETY